jgi:hypothetical protein
MSMPPKKLWPSVKKTHRSGSLSAQDRSGSRSSSIASDGCHV